MAAGSAGLFRVSTLAVGKACITTFAGAPVSGASGTYKGTVRANPGSLLIDVTNLFLYINTGTKASPTWTKVGLQV
jgi:hypothetical protein